MASNTAVDLLVQMLYKKTQEANESSAEVKRLREQISEYKSVLETAKDTVISMAKSSSLDANTNTLFRDAIARWGTDATINSNTVVVVNAPGSTQGVRVSKSKQGYTVTLYNNGKDFVAQELGYDRKGKTAKTLDDVSVIVNTVRGDAANIFTQERIDSQPKNNGCACGHDHGGDNSNDHANDEHHGTNDNSDEDNNDDMPQLAADSDDDNSDDHAGGNPNAGMPRGFDPMSLLASILGGRGSH